MKLCGLPDAVIGKYNVIPDEDFTASIFRKNGSHDFDHVVSCLRLLELYIIHIEVILAFRQKSVFVVVAAFFEGDDDDDDAVLSKLLAVSDDDVSYVAYA